MVTKILPTVLLAAILYISPSLGQYYASQTQQITQNAISPSSFLHDILSTANGRRALKLLQLIKSGILNQEQSCGSAVEINEPCNGMREYLPIIPNLPIGQYIQNGEFLPNQATSTNPITPPIFHQYKSVRPNQYPKYAGVNVLPKQIVANIRLVPKPPVMFINRLPSQMVGRVNTPPPNSRIRARNPPCCQCGCENGIFDSFLSISSPVSHVVPNAFSNIPPPTTNGCCKYLRKIPIPPPTL